MQYNNLVENYFFNPKHVGVLDTSQPNIFMGKAGSRAAGEMVHLYLHIEQGIIKSATFKAIGNVFVIAGAAYITEHFTGKALQDCQQFKFTDLMQLFEMPETKKHSAILIEDAVSDASTSRVKEVDYV